MYVNTNTTYEVRGDVLKGQESMTVSFWVYLVKRGDGWTNIFKKGNTQKEFTPSLSLSSEDGTIEVTVSTTKEDSSTMLSNGALQTGRWNHVAISVSLNMVVLYINGFLDLQKNFDEKIVFNNASMYFGSSQDRLGAEMFIDELKLFNTFLARQRIIENLGGDEVPFGINHVRLSCLDCSLQEVGYGITKGLQRMSGGVSPLKYSRADSRRLPVSLTERLEQVEN